MITRSDIDEWMAEAKATQLCPPDTGIVVATMHGRSRVCETASGNIGGPLTTHVDSETLFPICSLTKAITATLLMVLQEQGTVDIDAPLNEPDVLFPVNDEQSASRVTIRDILQHKTGIPTNDLLWLFSGLDTEGIRRSVGTLDVIKDGFRNDFVYSNITYASLSPILKQKTGRDFEDLVAELILAPLEMDDTRFGSGPEGHSNFAHPSNDDGLLVYRNTNHITPAGGLVSNLKDMAKWLRFNASKGETVHGNRLVSEATFDEMTSRSFPVARPYPMFMNGWEWIGSDCSYGLGHFTATVHNQAAFFHPGLLEGYSAGIAVLPESDAGIVVLCNANLSVVPPTIIGRFVSSVVGSEFDAPVQAPADGDNAAGSPHTLRVPPAGIEGVYSNGSYGTLTVTRDGSDLFLLYNDNKWKVEMSTPDRGTFAVTAFGMEIPIDVHFDDRNQRIYIPFSMDHRVNPSLFVKTS